MFRAAGWLYSKIADLRNSLYDRGIFKSYDLGARTISIGNITFGGTGKTPLVALVAEILAEEGENVCILTRGYGRRNQNERLLVSDKTAVLADAFGAGDEPVELAKQLFGKAFVVADANRVSAAQWAKEELGATAFVLDDGFQHRRAKRDVDLVCVDATDPFGEKQEQWLLSGWVREPLRNISRADAIVITRGELCDDVGVIVEKISEYNSSAEIFLSRSELLSPRRLEDYLNDSEERSESVGKSFAFSGLGNPKLFPRSLTAAGREFAGHQNFPDHMRYTQADIDWLVETARDQGANSLVTTAKDAVKLGGFEFAIPCFVIEVRSRIEDFDRFKRLITSS